MKTLAPERFIRAPRSIMSRYENRPSVEITKKCGTGNKTKIYTFYGFGSETQIAQPAAKVRVTIDLSMPMERPGWAPNMTSLTPCHIDLYRPFRPFGHRIIDHLWKSQKIGTGNKMEIYAFYVFGSETQIAQPAVKVRVTIDLSMPMERPGWTAHDHMTTPLGWLL